MEKNGEKLVYRPNGSGFACAAMNCHYLRYPLPYFLDAVQRYGFTNIELFGAMPHFFLDDVDEAETDAVAQACKARGLRIVCLTPAQGAYPMNISIASEKPRRRTLALLKRAIAAARRLGAPQMLVSPGFGYETQPKDRAWGICRQSLQELAQCAQENGVTLLLEPLTTPSSNVVNTSAKSARMLREVGSPAVKSMLDIGVMNFMGETVDEYFDNLGSDLLHVHFTDGPGAHVALGDGSFPMEAYASQIIRRGFAGTCSFEINDKRYLANPDAAMEKNIAWLKRNGYSA